MEIKIENILNLICSYAKSPLCYIIKAADNDYKILVSVGLFNLNNVYFSSFNQELLLKEVTSVENFKAFKELSEKFNMKSYYTNLLPDISNQNTKLYLVLFSHQDTLFDTEIIQLINNAIPSVCDYLKLNRQILINSESETTDENRFINDSDEQISFLLDATSDLVFALNGYGYYVMINENGAQALGFRSSDIIGKHFLEFIDENNKTELAIAFQKILSADKTTDFQAEFIDKYGKNVLFEIKAKSTRRGTEISGMLGYGTNISKQMRDKAKIKELNVKYIEATRLVSIERDRAKQQITVLEELNTLKNEFISNVSHELRTPLASIVGFSETITSDPDLPREMVLEFCNIILTEGKRLAKLVNDILDFSRLEAGSEVLQKIEFDIIEAVNEIIKTYMPQIHDKKLEFTSEIPDAQLIVKADRERVSKAIANLLSNAIKFTGEGGRISIILQNFLKEIEIIINDTGIGIPDKEVPKLFQKFSKVSRPGSQTPGTGFGLVTVKQIIDAHKGLVQIKSEVNRGTTVIVKIPKQ